MEISRKLLATDFRIEYSETVDVLNPDIHFHNSFELIYIREGSAIFKAGEKSYSVGRNSLIFINNLEAHQLQVTSTPYKRFFILLDPAFFQSVIQEPVLTSVFKHRPLHFHHVLTLDDGRNQQIFPLIKTLYEETNQEKAFQEIMRKAALQELFVTLYRYYPDFFPITSINKTTRTILEIQRHIEENCLESLSLRDVARKYYLDMYYLSHLFKKLTGFTFKDYLILQRLSLAKNRLFHTPEDITQVGHNSGFNNVNHFIRIFKKYEGITPYQYRKKFGK
jgi:YesN/AraC family two-component response regulator